MIQWPPSLADVVAAATVLLALGSAVANAVHGFYARQRMFSELNSLKKKMRVLWELAPLEDKLKRVTLTGFEDEDREP